MMGSPSANGGLAARPWGAPILVEAKPNARWSLDFVHDQFAHRRRSRIVNIVDDVTRKCLGAVPETPMLGRGVARELTAIIERRGARNDRVRPWHRVHLQRHARLVQGRSDQLALHRTGKADAKWVHREFQEPDAR
ncbi:hypothetical protein ACVWXO_000834 [Bradyrhizobium sp. LM2.7]